ncbi:MAG: hypothetical protein ACXVEF_10765 [Polyangiales bacterium]
MISARRRPTLIFGVFIVEAIAAWVLAAPWAETVSSVVGAHPDGDRAVFWRGGMPLLLDLQKRIGPIASGLVGATAIGLAVYAVFGVFLRGMMLASLSDESGDGDVRRAIARGTDTFFRLLAIGAMSVFFAVAVVVLVGIVPAYAISARTELWDPRRAAFATALPVLVALVLLAFVFSATDLARARVTTQDQRAIDAVADTVRDRRSIRSLLALSVPRWVASFGLLGWAAAFSTHSSSVAAIFVVHQLVALLRVGLRASVLARALRLVPREGV